MIIQYEREILKVMNYNIFVRDYLIIDKLGLYLEIVRPLIHEKNYSKFAGICKKVSNIIYDNTELKEISLIYLASSIIYASSVLCTKTTGKVPILMRSIYFFTYTVSLLNDFPEDEIILLGMKILKTILGIELYKKYSF